MVLRIGFVGILLCGWVTTHAEDLSVLPPNARTNMLRDALRTQVHAALDERLEQREALQTPEQITAWQKELRAKFIDSLGGFPERTPLNPQVVGTIDADGYRIEKVIYESRPKFFVTALLYLPEGKGPFPGVLVPCGHSANGKAYAAYQRICIMLAKHGMAALCFDPVGQGERHQILDRDEKDHATAPFKSTAEHNVTGVAPILLGENLATYCIWDSMRSLDYLASRPEVDPDRLGCTGNSGGGMMTSYMMALDDRIKAAAPGCFITTTRIKNETPGPGDAEQNIFGQINDGLDHADYVMLAAPRAVLICSATNDFVPIEGAWNSYRQAKRLYTKLGISERVSLVEADEKHGYTKPLRIAATQWFQRWLLGIDEPVTETGFPIHNDEELQCTPDGQVLLLEGARSLNDLYRDKAKRLELLRLMLQKSGTAVTPQKIIPLQSIDDRRKIVRQTAGLATLDELKSTPIKYSGSIKRDGYRIDKLTVTPEPGILLPALIFRPEKPRGKATLYLHGEGKQVDAGVGGPIEKLVKSGQTVLAVDLRGYGETESPAWRYSAKYSGPNAAEYFISYMLGQSLVGLRADDVLISTRYLQSQVPEAKQIQMIAVKDATVPALHAAALNPDLFASIVLREGLASWQSVIETEVTIDQLENTVHGALRHYDLPDLVKLAGEDKVTIESPRGADGERVKEK